MDLAATGTLRLFRVAGIDVRLHWSWLAVAVVQITLRPDAYQAWGWKVAEYVALFGLVLAHEFGHALACRAAGGRADRVVLWPLGGLAYVAPPPRPGAALITSAAGPLVNLALAPLLFLLLWQAPAQWPDWHVFVRTVTLINAGLFVLNLLPVYPLDGGQLLHALLWSVVGRWRGLLAVSVIGGGCAALLFAGSLAAAQTWGPAALVGCLVAAFVALRAHLAFRQARTMLRLDRLPRHDGCACPFCGEAPPRGACWRCACGATFDTFVTRGRCEDCGAAYPEVACPRCGASSGVDRWFAVGDEKRLSL
jgi:Zn-dependent protease